MNIYVLKQRPWQMLCDSCFLLVAPKEKALNYLKGERAARKKIKEEKTFQCELFTVHDSGASDVPLQPNFQLQNESHSVLFFCFFHFCVTEQSVRSPLVQCCCLPYFF